MLKRLWIIFNQGWKGSLTFVILLGGITLLVFGGILLITGQLGADTSTTLSKNMAFKLLVTL